MKGLTDIAGIRVGHASDYEGLTGCTAILCEGGAVAGADISGGASGTTEFETMSPWHVTDRIHGLVFAGGSAFGLEAAAGVRRFLAAKGVGFPTRGGPVPIVPGAILFDLGLGKGQVRPTREMGESAAAAATEGPVGEGAVGAGTGATVGKLFGMERAMKSGVGSFTVELGGRYAGVLVSALVAVNAVGDVVDPATGKWVAGARASADSKEPANGSDAMRRGTTMRAVLQTPQNTTLMAVATNAKLDKLQAVRLAKLTQHGMIRTIRPSHTQVDGDLVVAMSMGAASAPLDAIAIGAAEAVSEAILRAVRFAKSLGGLPGLAG